jgi:hypothetical protein
MNLFDFLRRMFPMAQPPVEFLTTEDTESTEPKKTKGRDGSPSRPKKKPAAKKAPAAVSKKKPSRKVK